MSTRSARLGLRGPTFSLLRGPSSTRCGFPRPYTLGHLYIDNWDPTGVFGWSGGPNSQGEHASAHPSGILHTRGLFTHLGHLYIDIWDPTGVFSWSCGPNLQGEHVSAHPSDILHADFTHLGHLYIDIWDPTDVFWPSFLSEVIALALGGRLHRIYFAKHSVL